jgi:hypothetical protein
MLSSLMVNYCCASRELAEMTDENVAELGLYQSVTHGFCGERCASVAACASPRIVASVLSRR